MNKAETLKRLSDAQSMPVATLEDLRNVPKEINKQELETYLQDFVKPSGTCWLCEKDLFVSWGLAHGMAYCTSCGMDVKAYHYFEDSAGHRKRIECSLQYHPKNYSTEEK